MSRLTELIDIDGMEIKTSKERPLSNQGLGAILHKLYALEDLEDEIGCPLEVVFKALKEGSIEDEDGGVQIVGITICGNGKLYLHAINGDLYLLKDYQKTWWLKGDINNEN